MLLNTPVVPVFALPRISTFSAFSGAVSATPQVTARSAAVPRSNDEHEVAHSVVHHGRVEPAIKRLRALYLEHDEGGDEGSDASQPISRLFELYEPVAEGASVDGGPGTRAGGRVARLRARLVRRKETR
ncbi:MAG: hypothetical protein JWL83_3892 [Actinomycetia bacterium]|nr:hypothetical protein [Actinomycetes bacterium]